MVDIEFGSVRVLVGDALARLRELADVSIDALVTDPPAGIAFMGREWDTPGAWRAPISGHGYADGAQRLPAPTIGSTRNPVCRRCHRHKRGRNSCGCDRPEFDEAGSRLAERSAFVSFMTAVAGECLRVLKPGAHGVVWAIPRTSHWTATALEDAGFEVRDIVHHHFGQGFPKSRSLRDIGRPELGTALKPATEHWIVVRKPLGESTVAANVLAYGTGALSIDGCRIPSGADHAAKRASVVGLASNRHANTYGGYQAPRTDSFNADGRWPANLVLSHAEGCRPVGTRRWTNEQGIGKAQTHAAEDGLEIVEAWECVDGCPVAELDQQSGILRSGFMVAGQQRHASQGLGGYGNGMPDEASHSGTYGDAGAASRFFYVAKASTAERNAGLPPGECNRHPTVKSLDLMRWLCRLVTPPGGTILDPFMGSGSTGCAAMLEGFSFVGIEQDQESLGIAVARIRHWGQRGHQVELGV